ncbi:hypothetical protein SS1G_04790 [Sclerotinia sclerotiorum 1980 UF-70]|uniref:3-phytase n=1 Tax=Sclerotinia sclerotiorum (strain ATCC 18683 / 1980 / Ss-1) TaxID=665079 RepID=A7EHJ8_SCLS1|nr:hypothetical protein SS1G_04790 [Sclerotinia sclerotiorum 1980 UF-70]EDO02314.1 hypothetical protein SS1G_04790 [Sclerotinia sclerotiorum 1980 UF-70]
MLLDQILLLSLTGVTTAALLPEKQQSSTSTSDVPQYFQTTPELWAGPTATGRAPFLAQTNPVSFAPTVTFVPNTPLETAQPIVGQGQNQSIFQLMGNLSPYLPNPSGFGVAEYPLPPGAKIAQLQMLSRHGSRYPTVGSNVEVFGEKVANNTEKLNATGALSFLNDWKYGLGHEILVPRGRQELYDSGILHYYQYAQLYNPHSKIIARTTTQDRMLKSAEYFMAGFFGLEWTNNATIEVIIESQGYNNSLAGYDNCPNSNNYRSAGGSNASDQWVAVYLQDATTRFQSMVSPEFNWTVTDTYAAQTLCPYETPFGARLDIELIKTPKPLAANRTYIDGKETTYIHFILNQRTIPLGFSFLECGVDRLDGWCELETFLKVQSKSTEEAQYEYACFGDYPAEPYGSVKNENQGLRAAQIGFLSSPSLSVYGTGTTERL